MYLLHIDLAYKKVYTLVIKKNLFRENIHPTKMM